MDRTPGGVYFEEHNKTLLTMIVPAYNCEAYIEEGLDSILSQMAEDLELIVVDDGSADGTREILSEYEGRQENLHICYADHRGASGARNTGLDLARGEYIAFMDCDDRLREGFLQQSRPMLLKKAALCIFGIERVFLSGNSEFWTVADRVYDSPSDFADEYIRTRKLLIYSNCNKFYRRKIIEDAQLRFEEGVSFGEDRLFNYRYITECGSIRADSAEIITSSLIMLRYLQRSGESMSTGQEGRSYDQIMRLHREKMRCFLGLSGGTTEKERRDFEAYDLAREMEALRQASGGS